MTSPLTVSSIHHLTLTVSNLDRARNFYQNILGFQPVTEFGPKLVMSNGTLLLVLNPPPEQPLPNDRFDENRVGLDHVSFMVSSRADLDRAVQLLDEQGVAHGEIKDLAPFQIFVLAFRDPDNIQLELTAPYNAEG